MQRPERPPGPLKRVAGIGLREGIVGVEELPRPDVGLALGDARETGLGQGARRERAIGDRPRRRQSRQIVGGQGRVGIDSVG